MGASLADKWNALKIEWPRYLIMVSSYIVEKSHCNIERKKIQMLF